MEKELADVEVAERAVFDFLLDRAVFSSIDGLINPLDSNRLKDALWRVLSLLKTINLLLISYEKDDKGYKNYTCKVLKELIVNLISSVEKDLGDQNG